MEDQATLEGIARSMSLVAQDCEKDALATERAPFNGHTVGTNFGNLYAQVQACANAIKYLAERTS